MDYSALIIDVVGSREYLKDDLVTNGHKRQEIQNFFMQCLEYLNEYFEDALQRRLVFSGGDEIQGLFCDPCSAFKCFRLLTLLMHPVKLRGGIGVGEWNVQMEEDRSASQDGLVYYNARRAITDAKKAKTPLLIYHQEYKKVRQLNASVSISTQICAQRTSAQSEVALLAEMLYPVEGKNTRIYEACVSLLHTRASYASVMKGSHEKKVNENPLCAQALKEALYRLQDSYVLKGKAVYSNYYIEGGKIPGLASVLVPLLGKTRQGLEKTIKNSHITLERNIALSIFELFDMNFGTKGEQS